MSEKKKRNPDSRIRPEERARIYPTTGISPIPDNRTKIQTQPKSTKFKQLNNYKLKNIQNISRKKSLAKRPTISLFIHKLWIVTIHHISKLFQNAEYAEKKSITFITMMNKHILASLAIAGCLSFAHAQNEPMKYQRSSLHLVLLTTDEPTLPGAEDMTGKLSQMWQSYPFPDKYDRHDIGFTDAYGGKPKGSMMELITKYQGKLDKLGLKELKEISAQIADNKLYVQNLIDTTTIMLSEQKVGQQLLRKWYGINDDGTWNPELLNQRGMYNASQSDVADAGATVRGLESITDRSEDLIGNTFLAFSKLAFYENEPVAAFSRDVAKTIIQLSGLGMASVAADKAYDATKNGYSAHTTTVLYRMVWNDSTKALFYSTFSGDKIDMAKFNAIDFPFELVGVEKAQSSTFDPASGLLGKESAIDDQLIEKTLFRNIDKVMAKLQHNYDVFKPLVPIISTNPLLIDAGLKESIGDKDKFELLEGVLNPETDRIEYKRIAILPVVKGKVWDNRYMPSDEKTADEAKGTELKANKKAAVGMVVRLLPKKK